MSTVEIDDSEVLVDDKKKKLTQPELISELISLMQSYEANNESFNEKFKQFEADKKEHDSIEKKLMRNINNIIGRINKVVVHEHSKKKPRNTTNAGKGGFNKPLPVPEVLRKFIGINDDELMSRPQVTKLLNQKFQELDLMKKEKDDNEKVIKIIILDKATAKKLHRTNGDKIRTKDIQTFISQFYHEEKAAAASS
jgi:hypothetical protein